MGGKRQNKQSEKESSSKDKDEGRARSDGRGNGAVCDKRDVPLFPDNFRCLEREVMKNAAKLSNEEVLRLVNDQPMAVVPLWNSGINDGASTSRSSPSVQVPKVEDEPKKRVCAIDFGNSKSLPFQQ